MSFKDISCLELWQPLCSVDWNQLCNLGKRHHEEQSCEFILNLDQLFRMKCRFIILNLGQWFNRKSFTRYLIWSSGGPPVGWIRTIYAILQEGIMGNIHVKYEIWTSGSEEVV